VNGFTIWEIDEAGQLGERLAMPDTLNVTEAAFSSDGRWLATGRTNGVVSIWDAGNDFLLMHEERAHDEDVTSLRFSDDGALLISGSQDGSLVLYNILQLVDTPQSSDSAAVEAACVRANRNLTQAEWQRYFGDESYRPTCAQIGSRE
jgi:WD40 repeat protein